MSDNADIKELAVAAWRLEKWLDNLNSDRKMAAKSALRSIKKFIAVSDVEVIDPIGSKFDPGLAVEVINNEAEDADEKDLIIIETLTPYVYMNGELIQHARVIIGTTVKALTSDIMKNEDKIDDIDYQHEGSASVIQSRFHTKLYRKTYTNHRKKRQNKRRYHRRRRN